MIKAFYINLVYLIKHKYWVFVAGRKFGCGLWRLIKHDWSKFLPDEFIPYALYFYHEKTKINEEKYTAAFVKHIRRTDHHYQSYLKIVNNQLVIEDIPKNALLELLSDWAGAGRAKTGKWDLINWYNKNKDNVILSPNTRETLENYLNLAYEL